MNKGHKDNFLVFIPNETFKSMWMKGIERYIHTKIIAYHLLERGNSIKINN